MSRGASEGERENSGGTRGPLFIATACEVALIFTGILLYIWRWQRTSPHAWMALWALILVSHVLHRDTLRGLGLTSTALQSSAQWILPLAVLLYLPLLCYGFAHHRFLLLRPTWPSLVMLLGYGSWCAFQQYLAQSYFKIRLARCSGGLSP